MAFETLLSAGRRTGLALALLMTALPAAAQRSWTGADTASWFVGTNWDPVGVPFDESVLIDTDLPNATVINGAAASAINALTVAETVRARLTLENGGELQINGNATIGDLAGSDGLVAVDGAGSSWDQAPHTLTVGHSGQGILTVSDGASLDAGFVGSGNQPGGSGLIVVTGSGTLMGMSANFEVGGHGEGELQASDGAVVNSGSVARVGSNGTGMATISGVDTEWNIASNLYLGANGGSNGGLLVTEGGRVSAQQTFIGWQSDATGELTVSGASSLLELSSHLRVGDQGNGELTVSGGGEVSNTWTALVAAQPGSQGAATVTGAGSQWNIVLVPCVCVYRGLVVGAQGPGSLEVTDGGVVNSHLGGLGSLAGGTGTATVDGPGSAWNIDNEFFVGGDGVGLLHIEDGATVASGGAAIGSSASGQGEVTLAGVDSQWQVGGQLSVGYMGTGALSVGPQTQVGVSGEVQVAESAGSSGTLQVDGTLTAAATAVNAGGWLGGTGEVVGSTTVSGTLAPGDPVGVLTIGRLTLAPQAVLVFDLGTPGPTGNDRVAVQADLVVDGDLQINALPGFSPGTYRLFEYGGTLTNHFLTIVGLPPGLAGAIDTDVPGEINLVVWEEPDEVFSDRFEQH